MTPNNPPSGGTQPDSIKLICCYAPDANEAFRVYSAIAKLAVEDNELGCLPMMQAIRGHALQMFLDAFEVG